MTGSRRSLFAAAVLGGALAALLGTGRPGPALADTVDDAVKAFEDYLKTKPEPSGIVNQVGDLAQKHDPKVAKAFLPLLRHADDTVRIAVLQNIGKQKDPKVIGPLMGIYNAAEKEKPKKYKIMAAALEGIGDADAKANAKFLIDEAKSWVNKNGDVGMAAFRAAANHVTRDLVDDFIAQLAVCDSSTTADNAEKRAARNACKPVIMDLLQKMTGLDIKDAKIWKEWWDKNGKTWKPKAEGKDEKKDLNASDEFADEAYGFILKRPNKRWTFQKPDGGNPYIQLEALDEGQKAAWCELRVVGSKGLASKTADALAAEHKEQIEGKFREFKEQVWDKKGVWGGEKSVEHVLFGPHKDYSVVAMHNVFIHKSEVHYYMYTYWVNGKPQSLRDDIDQILKDFKLMKR